MKVLFVNTFGLEAGATHRLHKGLASHGIDARMLVNVKQYNEVHCMAVPSLQENLSNAIM